MKSIIKTAAIPARAVLYILLSATIMLSSCFSGDTAIVTIQIHGRSTAAAPKAVQPASLIDRFLMLFSSPAWAWEPDPGDVRIVISAPGMDTIDEFPVTAASVTYEVPAGVPVTIEITSVPYEDIVNYGARSTVTLSPGQESTIVMNMIPVSSILDTSYDQMNIVRIGVDDASPYALGYRIYRSDTIDGPYEFINPQPEFSCDGTCYGSDVSADYTQTYYYMVSVVSEFGEGLLSDPEPYEPVF